jgi:hypothetical protein
LGGAGERRDRRVVIERRAPRYLGKALAILAPLRWHFVALPAPWPLLQFAGTHGM